MLDDMMNQSRRIADRLEDVLAAACDGTVSCEDAARIGYVGISIAANNAVHLAALRLRNGLPGLPPFPTGQMAPPKVPPRESGNQNRRDR